jgi:hypothetical protein
MRKLRTPIVCAGLPTRLERARLEEIFLPKNCQKLPTFGVI